MQGKRTERIAELIKQELSEKIITQLKDPRVALVTITHVEISDDLKYAKVFYSAIGDEKKKNEAKVALESARGLLQHDISKDLKLRFTPHLDFVRDSSFDEGIKIDKILDQLKQEDHEA